MVRGRSPFATHDEERTALERIDAFMLDVIIPLAAKTNAVVVCEAVQTVGFFDSFSHLLSTLSLPLPFLSLSVSLACPLSLTCPLSLAAISFSWHVRAIPFLRCSSPPSVT